MSETDSQKTSRRTRLSFLAFTLFVCAGVALYVALRYRERALPVSDAQSTLGSGGADSNGAVGSKDVGPQGKASARSDLDAVRTRPHAFIRSAKRDEFGQIAVITLAEAAPNLVAGAIDKEPPSRALSRLNCERFAFAHDRGICVVDNRINLIPPAKAQIVDRDLGILYSVDLAGIPSRARVSRDGRYAVATVFTTGDDYESEFSTRTTLIDTHTGDVVGDLEQFRVTRDNQVISEVDFNFWGVTFKDDSNQFYATLGSKGKTHLVLGNIQERQLKVLRDNVECPSLSPDQKRLVFKSREQDTRGWRLHALDLASNTEWTLLSETRSIDDQVEWLDDGHVLYRVLEDRGLPEQALSIWSIPVARGAQEQPRLFSQGASSPSVQRSVN